jgi:hypothetical protein
MTTFHTLKASSNLSGLNVSLRDGTIYAGDMTLNKTQLNFKDEIIRDFYKRDGTIEEHEDQIRELQIKSEGIAYMHDYTFMNTSIQIENTLDEYGMDLLRKNVTNNVTRIDRSFIGVGDLAFETTDASDIRHSMFVNPKKMEIFTPTFSLTNTGSIAVEGKGVTINTNASGLSLKGDMISADTGGYINKYLKVQIYDEGEYKDFVIPLMSAP